MPPPNPHRLNRLVVSRCEFEFSVTISEESVLFVLLVGVSSFGIRPNDGGLMEAIDGGSIRTTLVDLLGDNFGDCLGDALGERVDETREGDGPTLFVLRGAPVRIRAPGSRLLVLRGAVVLW